MWIVENVYSGNRPFEKEFTSREETQAWISRMGPIISRDWVAVFESDNTTINRMINEGLEKNDLNGILLPRVSIDEYLPADAESDNIVFAFFIKGVPEAVIPFRDFLQQCNGVLDVDYGDSDTIVNTSVVYAEMDRENFNMGNFRDIMIQVSMLTGLSMRDFTMTFPHTNKKFPFDLRLVNLYFRSRTKKDNLKAQEKARRQAEKEKQEELEKLNNPGSDEDMNKLSGRHGEGTDERVENETNESLVERLVGAMLREVK